MNNDFQLYLLDLRAAGLNALGETTNAGAELPSAEVDSCIKQLREDIATLKRTKCRSVYLSYLRQMNTDVMDVRSVLQNGLVGAWTVTGERKRRIARDGNAYTYQEYVNWYGTDLAVQKWKQAKQCE